MVVLTAMAGYAMSPDAFVLSQFASCCVGTALLSSSANSINQVRLVKQLYSRIAVFIIDFFSFWKCLSMHRWNELKIEFSSAGTWRKLVNWKFALWLIHIRALDLYMLLGLDWLQLLAALVFCTLAPIVLQPAWDWPTVFSTRLYTHRWSALV